MFPSIRRPFSDTETPVSPEELLRAVMDFLGALDPDDARRILQKHPFLVDDEALNFLDGMIAVSRDGGDDAARGLLGNWERLRDLLDDAITDGIPAAVARAKQRGEGDARVVRDYLSLPPIEMRDFVERHRSTILDQDLIERMQRVLADLTETEDAGASEYVALRVQLLFDVRAQGLNAAWNAFLSRFARWYVQYGAQFEGGGREE